MNLSEETKEYMSQVRTQLKEQTGDIIDLWPAWALRSYDMNNPNPEWIRRWNAAGDSINWRGAIKRVIELDPFGGVFIALKSSPIWKAIGTGAGGYSDVIGNPFPPFTNSNDMVWEDVEKSECDKLGLFQKRSRKLSADDKELIAAARKIGWDEKPKPTFFDLLKSLFETPKYSKR